MRMLFAIALVLLPAATVKSQDGAPNFVEAVVQRLELGEPIQTEAAILFPLILADAPEDAGVDAMAKGSVEFAEPEKPARRHDILVRNGGKRPVLIPAGLVLEGGRIDRMVANDGIVPAGAEVELRALPAASSSDVRETPAPFRTSPALAPLYLRRKAEFDFSESLVPTFVARWIEFRNDGDKRRSLAAIQDSAQLAEYSLRSREQASGLPKGLAGRTVVGGISAVRGRIQMLTVFGTNGLVEDHFDALVRGVTFVAAAIEIRAKAAGVPLPGKGDPAKTLEIVKQDAEALLAKLKKASYDGVTPTGGEAGETFILRLPGNARGRAVGLDGKLVHLAVYPYDPVEARLYAATVDPDAKLEPLPEKVEDDEDARPPTDEENEFLDGWIDRVGRGGRGGGARAGGGGGRR